jgi:superfamily II DNA or RNA helicase
MSTLKLIANATGARLTGASPGVSLQVYNLLSYFVEGAERSYAYRNKHWDGRASFYTPRSGTFPAGFYLPVLKLLIGLGVKVNARRETAPPALGPPVDKCALKTGFALTDAYRYQREVTQHLLTYQQMICQAATGAGKSNVAAIAYWHIARPTLFLTTRSVLAHQMRDTLMRLGEKEVGFIGDSRFEVNRGGFNVGMVQTLASHLAPFDARVEQVRLTMRQRRHIGGKYDGELMVDKRGRPMLEPNEEYQDALKRKKVAAYMRAIKKRIAETAAERQVKRDRAVALLQHFEFLILEEAHEVGSDSFYRVCNACTNAHYRLALTATPFMRSNEESSMRLIAASGPVGYRVSEKQLIDLGILATPKFKFIDDVPKPAGLTSRMNWHQVQKVALVENEARNERICAEAVRAVEHGLPVLILVVRKAHGELLKAKLGGLGVAAEFIRGETAVEARAQALAKLSTGELSVLIGSTIADVGIDLPSLGMVILAGGGRTEEGLRQRIGRALRAKKAGPNIAYVVDFTDRHHHLTRNHAIRRRRVIETTEGFAEGILAPGADFDWSVFKR